MNLISQSMVALRWSLIIRFSSQAVSWAITIMVMRMLTPADYGLLAMTAVFLDYVTTLAEMGMTAAVVQEREISERKLREVLGVALVMSAGAALLVYLSGPVLAQFYREPRLTAIVRAFSLQFLMSGLMVVPRGLAQRTLAFKTLSLIQLGGAVVGGLTSLTLAFAGQGVWSLVTGNLVSILLRMAAMNLAWPFLGRPRFSLDSARHMVSFGTKMTGVGLLWLFWYNSHLLIAGRLLGKELLGAYSIAYQLASMPLARFSETVTQVAFPAFARLQHDPEAIRRHLMRSLRILAAGGVPVFWGISCIAPELITVVIGPRWSRAVLPLSLLALIMPARLLSTFTSSVMQGFGRAEIEFRNMLLLATVMPVSFFVGCHWGGLVGLSVVWITVLPCLYCVVFRNSFGVLGLRISTLVQALRVPILAGAAMYGAVTWLRWLSRPWLSDAPRGVLLALAGATIYSAVNWALDRGTVSELLRLLRSVVRAGAATTATGRGAGSDTFAPPGA